MADAAFAAKRSNMVSNLQMTPWRPGGRDSDADYRQARQARWLRANTVSLLHRRGKTLWNPRL